MIKDLRSINKVNNDKYSSSKSVESVTKFVVDASKILSKKKKVSDSPHVDQVLSERNGIGITADGDRAVGVAALALLAI